MNNCAKALMSHVLQENSDAPALYTQASLKPLATMLHRYRLKGLKHLYLYYK